ncbi:MAG: FAD-binding protein [Acidobacteria bacterium]|jgi:thioredoxin reductase (NADPH)|nr:MAG: FAD-binding protein [Acidobacteriota bacterium]GIU81581.1 MAG: thioredoxin reductase [Pyrinomonadaceae bacterium]
MSSVKKHLDVIIIGAGVAGMSAALWCDELKLKAVILEKENRPGGQLHIIYNRIENHLGIKAKDGADLYKRFLKHLESRNISIKTSVNISKVDLERKEILLSDGKKLSATNLIIATGVRRRKLNIEGEDEFQGKGILTSGKKDAEKVRGKTVCIIGGGDAALENALILSQKAKKVFLIHRREDFRARSEFIEKVKNNGKIEVLTNTVAKKIIGHSCVEGVELEDLTTKQSFFIPVQSVLIRIGVEPNTELFKDQVETDSFGYIRVNENCETNLKGVFAVGDVANRLSPTISTAVGTGATAVKFISTQNFHA